MELPELLVADAPAWREWLEQLPAAAMLETLSSTNRYALIYRVNAVKRAETRARKIAQFVEMLARGETVYPQKPG
jgi:uncharacterized protein YdeI (YjbR/CyaY-like superfamily)